MFRIAPQLIARPTLRAFQSSLTSPSRRLVSTAAASRRSRSWKSLGARLGISGAVIYLYNTADVFSEEPTTIVHALPETEVESEYLPTIEAISSERQKRKAVQAQLEAQKQNQQPEAAKAQQHAAPSTRAKGDMEGLEEEADQQSAFNPETGEINWDCPCLGGMANGPCGEDFKAAFSCFVYSSEEPKGIDCIDKFKNMQNCFRQYPEIYGSEMDSDADANDEDDMTTDVALPPQDSSSPAPDSATASGPNSTPASPSLALSTASSEKPLAPSSPSNNEDQPSNEAHAKLHSQEKKKPSLVPDNYKPKKKNSAERTE